MIIMISTCSGQTVPNQIVTNQPINNQSIPNQVATDTINILARDEAIKLALDQASAFKQAQLNEQILSEDILQARKAFLPQISSPSAFIYTSPTRVPDISGQPRTPSFIANNAVTEYLATVSIAGEIDLAGKLRATLKRNIALLRAAQASTEVARRALIQAVDEGYYGYALSVARRQAAELNLTAAQKFEQTTDLLFQGGEVAQIDLTRARLQSVTRMDEMEQAKVNEYIALEGLRLLIGYPDNRAINVSDLTTINIDVNELDRFSPSTIINRAEVAQFDAQHLAAQQDYKVAHAARFPQLSYTFLAGFDTDSLHLKPLGDHSGVSFTVNINIPIFDWGINKSKERQAQFRMQNIDAERVLALRNFNQEYTTSRLQALSAAMRIKLLRASLVDAENNVQISLARYQAGEAQILEVTDAQTTLATQRTALYQALFDYQISRLKLARATGQ